MTEQTSSEGTRIRAAEVIGSLCLATDLGMGLPFEHGLQVTRTTMRLCDALGVDSETATQTYYAALLTHVGCTVDAEDTARIFRGSMTATGIHRKYGSPLEATIGALAALPSPDAPWPVRAAQFTAGLPRAARYRKPHFAAVCEVAEMLAEQLGLPQPIYELFPFMTERWDGWSNLRRAKGDEVPLPLRIAHVGSDITYQRLLGGDDHAIETIRARSGHAFDPRVVDVFLTHVHDILDPDDSDPSWERVLAIEPKPWINLEDVSIDRALASIGAFADLVSSYLSGHSVGVGNLAYQAAKLADFKAGEADLIRQAGYVLDVGKVAVHPRIWVNEGRLSADEWEQVRLHPYHTERVLARSPYLAELGDIACTHHERIDGSGYHRSLNASSLSRPCRLLAAADAFRSKLEPRPYRDALSAEDTARAMAERVRGGSLDAEMVAAVVEAAGMEPPPIERPAGLTEREAEVIGYIARGLQTKQVARALDISIKTADRHLQNAYRKMGVSTRAGATLFATEHGLVRHGDLPASGA